MLHSLFRKQSIQWLIAEFIIVVLGVMTAMAADSWLNNRRQVKQTKVYKQRLIDDLKATHQELSRMDSLYRLSREFGKLVDDHLSGVKHEQFYSKLLLATFHCVNRENFRPITATWEDVKSSGALSHFDIDLRRDLADFFDYEILGPVSWDLSDDFREVVRGTIPSSIQPIFWNECSIYTIYRDQDPISCQSGLREDIAKEVFEILSSQEGFREGLTLEISQIFPILDTSRAIREDALDLIRRLQESMN